MKVEGQISSEDLLDLVALGLIVGIRPMRNAGAGAPGMDDVEMVEIPAGWFVMGSADAEACWSTGSRRICSRLPSAEMECSTSCRVAMTRRVIGRLPSGLRWTCSAETRPSSGERSARSSLAFTS